MSVFKSRIEILAWALVSAIEEQGTFLHEHGLKDEFGRETPCMLHPNHWTHQNIREAEQNLIDAVHEAQNT